MKKESNIALGAGFGVAIGAVLGASTDNMGLWICVGIALGAGFGMTLGKKNDNNKS
ncbi:G-protein coupled receptor 153 [Flavobacteriaceae bacterium]|jgi:hypothetical protein|nr:G-protein coupled receptor 153 [Flavobacteriaceae bacterium]MDA9184357.1 G-protein coupled receptor 153 [Flavobacteriaceae bacterium]MDA9294533.1 G-protein coupled receptor 153 [Flavobacteriaceae bacterium]MDA9330771.1 G-protein coupled receptor 153 [Flavobacteriaceae bacterium]MDA9887370.1 G-protein coupled receptor 153 [Flavobacteriaceae bacterium]